MEKVWTTIRTTVAKHTEKDKINNGNNNGFLFKIIIVGCWK